MTVDVRFAPIASAGQLATAERLAREIWHEHYVPLIGCEQVDYMVSRLQTVAAMQAQLAEGYEYFLMEHEGGAAVGYLAVQPRAAEGALFLSKLYVLAALCGEGLGRRALEFAEELARGRGLARLYLTVNKRNPARFVYERLGYATVADIVTELGGGFVMDDYRMEKFLT